MKVLQMVGKILSLTVLVIVIIPVTIAFTVTAPVWAPAYLYLSGQKHRP